MMDPSRRLLVKNALSRVVTARLLIVVRVLQSIRDTTIAKKKDVPIKSRIEEFVLCMVQ